MNRIKVKKRKNKTTASTTPKKANNEKKLGWLASFSEQNPMPELEIDKEGKLSFINPSAQRLFPDLAKKRFEHPFLMGTKPLFKDLNKKGDGHISREIRVKDKWYIQFINRMDLDRLRIYSFDITDHKKGEEVLKESEERFRAMFENTVEGILLADPASKRFFMANNAICRMFGYEPEELKKIQLLDLHMEKETPPYVLDQFERILAGEFNFSKDVPMKRKDGSVFYVDVKVTKVVIAKREYLLGIFHDVTEIKAADALARAAAAKEEFLSLVSHDLKSPLHIIKRATNLLIEEPDISDVMKERASIILRQTSRGLRFVDNLLQLKQLKSGDVKLELSKFHFLDLLNDIVKDYKFNLEQVGIGLRISSDNDYDVLADQAKISHVIGNIIDNAIKFTPKGGTISINVSLEANVLKVSITDTGRGIPPEKIERIFGYYEQVYAADIETGTGIGLAITRYICKLHGGNIWAESEAGKGATFIFTLPNANIATGLAVKNILIIDDMAEDREITKAILEKNNFRVEEAGDWKKAMEKIRSCKIDAVLLDVQMPGMSGLELLEVIRKEQSKESLPVIIYSSKKINAEVCSKLGANSCVSKGAEAKELIEAIKNL